MIKVIIVEDEKWAAEKLMLLLGKTGTQIEVAGVAASVDEAISLIESTPDIDLGFFDVRLADGLSFSIFDRVNVSFPVIFTTAYESYAVRAFKLHSIDYLLKPVQAGELQAAIDKYERLWKKSHQSINAQALILETKKRPFKNRFIIKVGEHLKMVMIEEIPCFYSFSKGTFLSTYKGRNYLIDHSLYDLETLVDPALFFRINRKYLININYIKDMISYSNSRLKINLTIECDDDLIVSREKVKSFKDWLEGRI